MSPDLNHCQKLHGWIRHALFALVAVLASIAAGEAPRTNVLAVSAAALTGPTVRLSYSRTNVEDNTVSAFMYFLPLIAPDPVTITTVNGDIHRARILSAKRKFDGNTFTTHCDFEFTGKGKQLSVFDLSGEIRRHEKKLKSGGTVPRQLASITVDGPGMGAVEVEGVVSNGVRVVTEVRLQFNAQGQTSPVTIGLCDIGYADGKYPRLNELVARVNTLKFKRQPGRPKMEVTLDSISDKDAGTGLWQNFKSGLKGMAANLFIPPLDVERVGNDTMLDFGAALTAAHRTFTFPKAKNLRN